MSNFVSRGFGGRRRAPQEFAERRPPGQYFEPGFPALTAGPTPMLSIEDWSFRIDGMVTEPAEWSWESFHALPFETVPCDIHCVTKWSKLGTSFGGVSVDALLESVGPQGDYAMAFSYGGYTTNLPLADLTGGRAWIATEHEGKALPRARGSCAAPRPGPLLLEEREVDCRPAHPGPRRARLLGTKRLPQPRRSWKEERYWSD
jgi:DMSO/TMAO reductase YedYZ molybdopterin-dependent catalytic subunit